jgi:hypothetical protein
MPDDTAKKLLWDAPKAAQKIVRFAEGRDFKAYCEDEMLSAAIERQFESSVKRSRSCVAKTPTLRRGVTSCRAPSPFAIS